MNDFVDFLKKEAKKHAKSKGYTFSADFDTFLAEKLREAEGIFEKDSREQAEKKEQARRNVVILIDQIITKLPEGETEIQMHEWIHDFKSWVCPLFPFC